MYKVTKLLLLGLKPIQDSACKKYVKDSWSIMPKIQLSALSMLNEDAVIFFKETVGGLQLVRI